MSELAPSISGNDVSKLSQLCDSLFKNAAKPLPDLLRQAAYFADISAAKATPIGDTSKLSKLPKKARMRPIVAMPTSEDIRLGKGAKARGWLYRNAKTGFIFGTVQPVQNYRARGMERISRAIKFWDKKKKAWGYLPYFKDGSRQEAKNLKIPHAGAAKAGYLKALSLIGNVSGSDTEGIPNSGMPYATVNHRLTGFDQFILIVNEVLHTETISPESANIGLQKAANRMEHIYAKQLESIFGRAST